jgi:hypothetical protein
VSICLPGVAFRIFDPQLSLDHATAKLWSVTRALLLSAAGPIIYTAIGSECHAQSLKRGLDGKKICRGRGRHAIRKFSTHNGRPRNTRKFGQFTRREFCERPASTNLGPSNHHR